MSEPKNYADVIHFDALLKIKRAFISLNSSMVDAGHVPGLDLEVSEIVVHTEGEPYARAFYLDGDVYVEPLFNLVRSIEDR